MERKHRIKSIVSPVIWLLTVLIIPNLSKAQSVTYLNDKSKTYQIRSMENGKWEFHPGWYYMTLHKKYSGGYWSGAFGLNISWDVNKSDVKQIEPLRISEAALEAAAAEEIQEQIDIIELIAKEETIRSAERMADLMYPQYEKMFKKKFDKIDAMALLISTLSMGRFVFEALELIEEKEVIKEEIDYIHGQGPTQQMEQAKRQIAYEEALQRLEKLLNKSYKLANYAQTINNLKK